MREFLLGIAVGIVVTKGALLVADYMITSRTKEAIDNQETTVAAEPACLLKTPATLKEICAAHTKGFDDFTEPRPESSRRHLNRYQDMWPGRHKKKLLIPPPQFRNSLSLTVYKGPCTMQITKDL